MNNTAYEQPVSYAALSESQAKSRSQVAALCFIAWDILLTTDLEVVHIWLTPWASSKVLYFITRYYSLFSLILCHAYEMTCRQWIVFEAISACILELSVEMMLILRLYAMYVGSTNMRRIMIVPFLTQAIVMIVSLGLSVPRIMTNWNCVEATLPIEMIIYCVTAILYEAFLFCLTIRRFFFAKRDGWHNANLLVVLLRDGVLAFLIIFVAMLTNTALFTIGPRPFASMGFPWLSAVLGTVGPRLMLNVRDAHKIRAPPSWLGDMEFKMDTALYNALEGNNSDSDDEFDHEGSAMGYSHAAVVSHDSAYA